MPSSLQTSLHFIDTNAQKTSSGFKILKYHGPICKLKTEWYAFLLSMAFIFLLAQCLLAQPDIQWDKTLGGSKEDPLSSVRQTTDGGYILGGTSSSVVSGDKSGAGKGGTDYWIVKLAANGTKEWDKTIGGTDHDYLVQIRQTADGGYILGGDSYSVAGADKTEGNGGTNNPEDRQPDMWIVKISADGTKQWDKTLLKRGEELMNELIQTSDGGYMAWGTGYMSGYMVKLSASGIIEWTQTDVQSIGRDNSGNIQTLDGGYILGKSVTAGYQVTKLSSSGVKKWEKTYASTGTGTSTTVPGIRICSDGSYILAGASDYGIGGDKTQASQGQLDYWIIKITSQGNKVWDKTFGGSSRDATSTINQTKDGGYLISGSSGSGISGDKTEETNGISDAWIIKITSNGTKQWDKTLGGSQYLQYDSYRGSSYLGLLVQDENGNYVLTGYSDAHASEDKTGDASGGWLVKLAANGTRIWDKTIGGNIGFVPAKDGGYISYGTSSLSAGATKTENSRGGADYWIVKLSAEATTKQLTPSAPSLSFTYKPGSITPVQTIAITGSAGVIPTLSAVKTENSKWLTVQQAADGQVSFSINANGLAAGAYTAVVTLFASDYSRIVMPVKLTVSSPEAVNTFVRINVGGGAYAASNSRQFRTDQYYAGIDRTSSVTGGDILNTDDDELYRSGRCSPSFSYNIPMANGKVTVILHFAEIWYGVPGKGAGGAGKRQFHVTMEGSRKLTNFDIFSAAGGAMRAVQKSIPVTITDGMLNIDFQSGASDLPRVSAIEVITTSITLKPVADAYIDGTYNRENFGTAPNLDVKSIKNSLPGRRSSYLKFPIGTAGIIGTAKLRVYGKNHENTNEIYLHAYGVDDNSWTENNIIFDFAPKASTSRLSYVAVSNEARYYELDVTSYVKAQQQTGDALVSFVLMDSNFRNTRLVFNSRENAANPPQLLILPAAETNAAARTSEEAISSAPEAEPEQSLVYPNPVQDQFNLVISGKHSEDISFDLLNSSGRSYKVVPTQKARAGKTAEIDISGLKLSSGIYLLKIKSEAATEVIKLLVTQ
jgi:hypothetical protein